MLRAGLRLQAPAQLPARRRLQAGRPLPHCTWDRPAAGAGTAIVIACFAPCMCQEVCVAWGRCTVGARPAWGCVRASNAAGRRPCFPPAHLVHSQPLLDACRVVAVAASGEQLALVCILEVHAADRAAAHAGGHKGEHLSPQHGSRQGGARQHAASLAHHAKHTSRRGAGLTVARAAALTCPRSRGCCHTRPPAASVRHSCAGAGAAPAGAAGEWAPPQSSSQQATCQPTQQQAAALRSSRHAACIIKAWPRRRGQQRCQEGMPCKSPPPPWRPPPRPPRPAPAPC